MSLKSKYIIVPPSPGLRDLVSHYWLCLNNADTMHIALPDGAVDLVVQVHSTFTNSWVYGTTTARTEIPLDPHCHYLGVRFRPGQSRHFIKPSARELTDTHESTDGLLRFPLDGLSEDTLNGNIADQLNRVMEDHLTKWSPSYQRIDDAIHFIEAACGAIQIREAAEVFGQSCRQFERIFLETVGVSAKTFAKIIRFQHTAKLLSSPCKLSLSYIAAELNYSDQSHMSHDFKRLAGVSPTQFLQEPVAFLQDFHLE